jgi:hypothetical protein
VAPLREAIYSLDNGVDGVERAARSGAKKILLRP